MYRSDVCWDKNTYLIFIFLCEGKTMNMKKAILKELTLAEERGDMELVALIKSQIRDMGIDAGVVGTIGNNKRAIYVHVGA